MKSDDIAQKTTTSRCLLVFEGAIRSEQTKTVYKYHLDRFLNWNETVEDMVILKNSIKRLTQKNLKQLILG